LNFFPKKIWLLAELSCEKAKDSLTFIKLYIRTYDRSICRDSETDFGHTKCSAVEKLPAKDSELIALRKWDFVEDLAQKCKVFSVMIYRTRIINKNQAHMIQTKLKPRINHFKNEIYSRMNFECFLEVQNFQVLKMEDSSLIRLNFLPSCIKTFGTENLQQLFPQLHHLLVLKEFIYCQFYGKYTMSVAKETFQMWQLEQWTQEKTSKRPPKENSWNQLMSSKFKLTFGILSFRFNNSREAL
jgi:hypothetical protein